MPRRLHLFVDESGNFDFSRKHDASRYFVLAAATLLDCSIVNAQLNELRHQMAWEGHEHPGPFHAAHDPSPVRNRVFSLIERLDVRVDVILLEKAKAMPHLRQPEERFYKHAWLYLMKYVAPRLRCDELLVVTASLGGKKKKRAAFYGAVQEVMAQVASNITYRTACWDASADGCLQVADYCGWAVQRKWESGDAGPHNRIAAKIRSEYDLFAAGRQHYY